MKFLIIIASIFFCLHTNGQNIDGKYCWSFKNNLMGRIYRCFEFDGNGRFKSELISDIKFIEEGDYEVLGNKLILTYDLVDETEFVRNDYEMYEIKKIKGWSFEKYYEISTGVKIGERLQREFIILKNKKEKLKLKNLKTKKRIILKRTLVHM